MIKSIIDSYISQLMDWYKKAMKEDYLNIELNWIELWIEMQANLLGKQMNAFLRDSYSYLSYFQIAVNVVK